jgi:hypothetical protein
MSVYVRAFLIAGVVIPVFLHAIARASMPWWPDTISLGLAFGVTAVLMVSKARMDRGMNRRLWEALRTLALTGFAAIAHWFVKRVSN